MKEIIPVLFFYNFELCDISINNSLNILLSELEYDGRDKRIAFVGISNYALDISKQNRSIVISRPDPNLNDLIENARVILKAYNNHANFILFEKISISYFSYKYQFEKLKKK